LLREEFRHEAFSSGLLVNAARYLESAAEISRDGVYRYSLSRRLSTGSRTVLFVGLNPSTADATQDDPTIRRCADFARRWGYHCLVMGNLYAHRATNPRELLTVRDPVGPRNEEALKSMMRKAEVIVAAWGKHRLNEEAHQLAAWILPQSHTRCLGRNQDGSPKHPLYLRRDTVLQKLA
jgi:hypothetical protein